MLLPRSVARTVDPDGARIVDVADNLGIWRRRIHAEQYTCVPARHYGAVRVDCGRRLDLYYIFLCSRIRLHVVVDVIVRSVGGRDKFFCGDHVRVIVDCESTFTLCLAELCLSCTHVAVLLIEQSSHPRGAAVGPG